MRRLPRLGGLGPRVFVLTSVVALAAVVVTAWLTLYQSDQQIVSSTAAQRQTIDTIAKRLREYAELHGTWEGVGGSADELAARTGARIRLLTADRVVIIDTSVGKPLVSPNEPATTLDVRPDVYFQRSPLADGSSLVPEASVAANAPTTPRTTNGAQVTWLTTAQVDELRDAILDYRHSILLAACLTRKGLPVREAGHTPLGVIVLQPDDVGPAGGKPDEALQQSVTGCQNLADTGAGAVDITRLRACAGNAVCVYQTLQQLVDEIAPAPLQLYVTFAPGIHIARRPVFLGTALVGLVTVTIAVLLARRVLRPIGRLTTAAGGLARGDLSARVPVHGHDELADLARTFNRMADSLQRSENRQRQMIADIAHELRTPLSNLRGYLEALKDGVLDPDPELFASLHEEALLQQRIVDDLQDLALAESGAMVYQRVPLDVADLLHTCATAHRAAAEAAGVDLVEDVRGRPVVHADADRLRQVIGNLVTNALRATPPGGTIRLGSETRPVPPTGGAGTGGARPGRPAPAGQVVITVRDTGVGMSARDLPRVFDRFWRADVARGKGTGGSGLGMAIAREIISAHGGTIGIASTPGVGTLVTVTLPAG